MLKNLLDRAINCHQRGQLPKAEQLYRRILKADSDHFEAQHLLGVLRAQQGRNQEALILLAGALKSKPDDADALYNRGNVLVELKEYKEALSSYEKALTIEPNYLAAHLNRGNALLKLALYEEAVASFNKVLKIWPDCAQALDSRGIALLELYRYDEALTSHDQALAINPGSAATLNNRGNVLRWLARNEEALATYDRALVISPNFVDALNNRGKVLNEFRRYDEALESYDKALAINPDSEDAFAGSAEVALSVCDWSRTTKFAAEAVAQVVAGKPSVTPLTFLCYCDDPLLQAQRARNYIKDRIPVRPAALWDGSIFRHDRIRIAYLSADFRRHAVANLIAGLFELHDRSKFEVLGLSFGPDDGSDLRVRIVKAFDQFHDVRSANNREVARLLKNLEIDIAIDLMGHTQHARPEIFAYRPAPIQANYLGYPGTTGADFIDYLIADKVVAPLEFEAAYTEKIVHLPDCYQVNDGNRKIADRVPTRREVGLPEEGFVFCCFNNSNKILPPLLEVWMRLLRAVEGSVLWLIRYNATAESNLRAFAKARNVDPTRLVFANPVRVDEHLARHCLADLFLDTLPYNAHTTASDALWGGLPVLTCQGTAFAGRVASSLLQAIGLSELITQNLADYEAQALRLANDGGELLRAIREKLARHRQTYPLFNTDLFRQHIEAAYLRMWETWQRGEPPQGFAVGDSTSAMLASD
jgi:protein O-GlcNAc transferase